MSDLVGLFTPLVTQAFLVTALWLFVGLEWVAFLVLFSFNARWLLRDWAAREAETKESRDERD